MKGGESMENKLCLICHSPVEKSWHTFCHRCLHSSIKELEERYLQKEGPVSAREDVDQAPVSEPHSENTHR